MSRVQKSAILLLAAALISRTDDLTSDEKNVLQDASGWEYIKISNPTGFQTQHPCFDGRPHPNTCRGNIVLSPSSHFVKNMYINNMRDQRKGKYKLQGKSVLFFDEFGQPDGPYTATLD